ncbi:hypothetical protein [Bradyrhizobium iriomotense]|nr:hypothetical protein [Bradyrhizobium iriomotense]
MDQSLTSRPWAALGDSLHATVARAEQAPEPGKIARLEEVTRFMA